jgi:GT2 family glycosyltransferase
VHVAVLIVAYRNIADVARCVAALDRSTYRAFEIVICENGGVEEAARLRKALPSALGGSQRITIMPSDNVGYAGGINRCLNQAPDADAWWMLNPDTVPEPEAMAEMVALLAGGEADAVGSILLDMQGRVASTGGGWNPWIARCTKLGERRERTDAGVDTAPDALGFISGASMLFGRHFLSVAGRMRDDYFLYCEEVEWCLRAIRRGLRLRVAGRAFVTHDQGSTTGSGGGMALRSKLVVYLDERNKLNVVRDTEPARLPLTVPLSLLFLLARYGRKRAWRQMGWAIQGWAAGIANGRGAKV